MDYLLIHRVLKHREFREGEHNDLPMLIVKKLWLKISIRFCFKGVAARLIRKDNKPRWEPARIEDVTEEQIMYFFKPLSPSDELPM